MGRRQLTGGWLNLRIRTKTISLTQDRFYEPSECVTGSSTRVMFMNLSLNLVLVRLFMKDFPGGSDGKASAYNAGDPGSIPGLGRFSGEGNGNPLQYLCLEISWTEESDRLQFMGSQRVRHDWVTSLRLYMSPQCWFFFLIYVFVKWCFENLHSGASLVAQWLRLCSAGDTSWIPGPRSHMLRGY